MKKCLRGDASHVEAGTAESAALLDASGLEAKLCRLDGGDVAAGSAADDDNVVVVRSRSRREGPRVRRLEEESPGAGKEGGGPSRKA